MLIIRQQTTTKASNEESFSVVSSNSKECYLCKQNSAKRTSNILVMKFFNVFKFKLFSLAIAVSFLRNHLVLNQLMSAIIVTMICQTSGEQTADKFIKYLRCNTFKVALS